MAERILVKAVNWLGDAVMTLPALKGLRALFPSARISVLTKDSLADLYRGAPFVDETILEGDRGLKGMMRLTRRIKEGAFDTAILFPASFRSALLIYLSGVPERVGFAKEGRSPLLTKALRRDTDLLRRHRVEYFLRLLEPFGSVPRPTAPRIDPTFEDRAWAAKTLDGRLAGHGPLVAMHPGATYGNAKRWYPDRYAAVGSRLSKERGARIAVIGGKAEADLAAEVARGIAPGPATSFAGETSLLQLAALLERASVLVTNDTGPMHLAAAVGTPIVAVFGPTDPVTTRPYGDRHTVVRHPVECSPCLLRECPIDHRCMTLIRSDEVYDAAVKWLGGA